MMQRPLLFICSAKPEYPTRLFSISRDDGQSLKHPAAPGSNSARGCPGGNPSCNHSPDSANLKPGLRLDQERKHSGGRRMLAALALLLAIPELFYFGLVYSPTMVAMCLVLSGHLMIRKLFRGDSGIQDCNAASDSLFCGFPDLF